MHYRFCPDCGRKLIGRPAGDEGDVPYCEDCHKYWFDSFSCSSMVLVANEFNEIALLTQNYLSDKYKTFISGYITPGETAEETAIREVQEEIGVSLDHLEYAGTYWFDVKGLLIHGFIGHTSKCDFSLSKEVDAAEWVPAAEAGDVIFPEAPGNAVYEIYKVYLKKIGQ